LAAVYTLLDVSGDVRNFLVEVGMNNMKSLVMVGAIEDSSGEVFGHTSFLQGDLMRLGHNSIPFCFRELCDSLTLLVFI